MVPGFHTTFDIEPPCAAAAYNSPACRRGLMGALLLYGLAGGTSAPWMRMVRRTIRTINQKILQ